MYITYGGNPNIFMFWLFPENGSITERTVNRALIVHTTTKKLIFIFTMYQNYPLALKHGHNHDHVQEEVWIKRDDRL